MDTCYPANFEEKTGFDQLRRMLTEGCFSEMGKRKVDQIGFKTDMGQISLLLGQTEEFRHIILSGKHFPGANYFDPEDIFTHLQLKDTFAEAEDLLDIRLSYETILDIVDFLSAQKDDNTLAYPWLAGLVTNMDVDRDLPGFINQVIDEKAEVKDHASQLLSDIRKKIKSLESKSSSRLSAILREGKEQGWIQQDVELSIRNGRLVIPVSATHKRRIRGFIHDHSATGQTVYLEPEEVFGINNQVRDLRAAERQEIIRILKAVADYLRPRIPPLKNAYDMLGEVDLIRAKARLAIEMNAQHPTISDRAHVEWIKAHHPLLYLAYKPQGKHVEPLSVRLDEKNRILVISGPNAGGKSVCLKTCGLIQYMLQCGLLVPMENYSESGIFNHLFIDIGDEQSLENDLSTYSSHLVNMDVFLRHADKKTLFLIDEFGSGTEPRIGGAIAEAILEQLHLRGSLGVVTTHYANLKLMAGKYPGIVNGSMLFDSRNMRPLFKLKTGIPGSSFAFEIARSIGLPDKLLERAAELSGNQDLDFDLQLQDLELKKHELEDKELQLRKADEFLSEMIDKYEALRAEVECRKNEILHQARNEARGILEGTNKIIEKTIRDIRESQADKDKTKIARKELDSFIHDTKTKLSDIPEPQTKGKKKNKKTRVKDVEIDTSPIQPGDVVRIKGQETAGEVALISGRKAEVIFGSFRLKADISELEKLKKGSTQTDSSQKAGSKMLFDINEKAASFRPEIDLRSTRVDEALRKIQTHLDDAFLLGVSQIRIIHGKGDGILRAALRDFLRGQPRVKSYSDEHPDRGGAGITIVDFTG